MAVSKSIVTTGLGQLLHITKVLESRTGSLGSLLGVLRDQALVLLRDSVSGWSFRWSMLESFDHGTVNHRQPGYLSWR